MSADIYYFSGTGNSLAVARDIAQKTKGNLINIASVVDKESVKTDADVIGIVFPTKSPGPGRIPPIIEKFVRKLKNINSKYIFAICTYGAYPLKSLRYLNKIIKSRGGKLAGGFAVHMPMNNPAVYNAIPTEKQQKMFKNWKEKLEVIYEYVSTRKTGKLEKSNAFINFSLGFIDLFLGELVTGFKLREFYSIEKFHADEKCDGCGICARVCPVMNIEMVGNKPLWHQNCEHCFACLQWCPKEAIQFGSKTSRRKRYHHPDVGLSDFLRQAQGSVPSGVREGV